MLTDLHIKNFALIDEAHIKFEPGLNIMTGETGAGKTIILEAMNLLLGKRADPVLIGGYGEEAMVEASLEEGKETTILARSVTASGKNKCYLNGHLANVAMVAERAGKLVDFHGQHEHQALLTVAAHVDYLDSFGGETIGDERRTFGAAFAEWKVVEDRLADVTTAERDRLSRLDLTRFQVDEIERAGLTPGEDEALERELILLKSAERLARGISAAQAALSGEEENPGATAALDAAAKELTALASVDERLAESAERLNSLSLEAADISGDLSSYQSDIVFDPARLNEAEGRLEMIKNLKRKYGDTIAAVLLFRDKAKQELELIEDSGAKLAELQARRQRLEGKLHEVAARLSDLRHQTAGVLEKTVEEELAGLNLAGCRFRVGFGDTLDLTATGRDRVEFLISPNVGQGLKPLAKIASGGEVSRIMLALKIAFIKADPVPVLVFDEIDSGIGGETAAAVGAKLKQLAGDHQVICITHLPQIAAYGDTHLFVSKKVEAGTTVSTVKTLDDAGRVEELSRMLTGGASTAESSRQHARELLQAARQRPE
jgi:DNA repair protein RecN (Recombination protein N)